VVSTEGFGRTLVLLGLALTAMGLVFWLGGRLAGLGHLPGDIYYRRGNFAFYFPLMTSVVLSLVLTIVLNLLFRK
jgi:hypothetical protein